MIYEKLDNLYSDDLHIKFVKILNDINYNSYLFHFMKDDIIIGELILDEITKIISIDTFKIYANYRQLKYGTKLLQLIIKTFKDDFLINLMASPIENDISLKDLIYFYEKNGFIKQSKIIEDSVYMEYLLFD